MSYGIAVAGDARADLRSLESWLQEEVWDRLELVAADPSLLTSPSPDDDISYEFAIHSAGTTHFVIMALAKSDSARIVTLLGVAHRPIEPEH